MARLINPCFIRTPEAQATEAFALHDRLLGFSYRFGSFLGLFRAFPELSLGFHQDTLTRKLAMSTDFNARILVAIRSNQRTPGVESESVRLRRCIGFSRWWHREGKGFLTRARLENKVEMVPNP